MPNNLPWLIAIAAGFGAVVLGLILALRPGQRRKPLPADWSLTSRPVFSAEERRVYQSIKEALPHHIVLSKLPLVRFCQPTDARETRYWFELLGTSHVGFAICSPNGRVLATIDLDDERGASGRSLQIKQSVLAACRVRHLRCTSDNLPSRAELQLLVPISNNQARSPNAVPLPDFSHTTGRRRPSINSMTPRRMAVGAPAEGSRPWQDAGLAEDSFFCPDSGFSIGAHGGVRFKNNRPLAEPVADRLRDEDFALDDIVGVVIDTPRNVTAPLGQGRRARC